MGCVPCVSNVMARWAADRLDSVEPSELEMVGGTSHLILHDMSLLGPSRLCLIYKILNVTPSFKLTKKFKEDGQDGQN
jgi:hypothetical protein